MPAAGGAYAPPMSRTLLSNARIFDGTGAPIAEGEVTVENGRILEVGSGLDGDTAIDLGGKALLPGFFDCHTHVFISDVNMLGNLQKPFSLAFFEAERNLRNTLATGITSIRDAGGADLGIKTAVETGLISGPHMQISLSMLSQTGGHGDGWMPSGATVRFFQPHPGVPPTIVDGAEQMRQKVRELIRMGADVIKVAVSGGVLSPRDDPRHAHFTQEELDVLVETARGLGRWVMAHAQAYDGIKNGIRAGIRSIDHGIYLDDEAIGMMLDRGTFLVPTLVAPMGVIKAAEAGAAIPEASVRKAREVIEVHRDSFRRAVEAGVKVAMGTDSGVTPHGDNLEELALMEAGGMSPTDVLVATTRTAAECLDVAADRGTIEAGKRADLVVIDGDPLALAGIKERVTAVFKDGRLVSGSV
jgi:imidazolonepropionase-like amidohydrolase